MSKVYIAVPTQDGWLHASLVEQIIKQSKGHNITFVKGVSPLAVARNAVVRNFLRSDCTHLWTIDADTVPPPDALEKLLALDGDIVSAVTPILTDKGLIANYYVTNDDTERETMEEALKRTTPFTVAGVGNSCMLINRRVFDESNVAALKSPWYTELWFQNGEFCECDIEFCNKATDEGYIITVDPTVVCKHIKEISL